jgi:Ala-tRNA(Pro) deacylase
MIETQAAQTAERLPTSPVQLMERLDSLGISYQLFHHRAVFTVAESADLKQTIPGTACRNLFIRDKKERMFLVTAANETTIDLKKLPALLGCDRLSFGSPERLWKHLGVRPGSVCPFAAINDKENAVRLVLDAAMMQSDLVNVHPLENTMSVALAPSGLTTFLRAVGHEPWVLDLSPAAPDHR